MRRDAPFLRSDVEELGAFFATTAVVSMREVHAGSREPGTIALRHDVDANPGAFECAVEMALWEGRNGWRSTYYLLHSAPYFADTASLLAGAEKIAEAGHEIGIHADALAEGLLTGRDPHEILWGALCVLRDAGHVVTGVAGHGNRPICIVAGFANDEQFVECARPNEGEPDRELHYQGRSLRIAPRPLADFDLEYEAVRLRQPGDFVNSDSGGTWWLPFSETVEELAKGEGQLHLLQHSDWWTEAFQLEEVAA